MNHPPRIRLGNYSLGRRRTSSPDTKSEPIKEVPMLLALPIPQRCNSTPKTGFKSINNAITCFVILNESLLMAPIETLFTEPLLSDSTQLIWLWRVVKKDLMQRSEIEQQFEPLWQRATVIVFLTHQNILPRHENALELQKATLQAAVKAQFEHYLMPTWDKPSTYFILSHYGICKWIQSSAVHNVHDVDQTVASFLLSITTPRARILVQRWLMVRDAFYALYSPQYMIPKGLMRLFISTVGFDKGWSSMSGASDDQQIAIHWVKAFFSKDDALQPEVMMPASVPVLKARPHKLGAALALGILSPKVSIANQWHVESLLLGDDQSDERVSTVAGGTTKAAVLIQSLEKKNVQFDGYCVLTLAQVASRLRNEQMGRIARLTTQRWERVVFMFDHLVFSAFDPRIFFPSKQVREKAKAHFFRILTRNNAYDPTAFEVSNLGIANFPDTVRMYFQQKREGIITGKCYSTALHRDILPMNRTLEALRQRIDDFTTLFERESRESLYNKNGFVTMDVIANSILEQEASWVLLKSNEKEVASLMVSVLGIMLETACRGAIDTLPQGNQAGQLMDIMNVQDVAAERLFVPEEKYSLIAMMLEHIFTHTLDWSAGVHILQTVCQRHQKAVKQYSRMYKKAMKDYQAYVIGQHADKIREYQSRLREMQALDMALQHACVNECQQAASVFNAISSAMKSGMQQWLQHEYQIYIRCHHLQKTFASLADRLLQDEKGENETMDFNYKRRFMSRLMVLHSYGSADLGTSAEYWYKNPQAMAFTSEWRALLSLSDYTFFKWSESMVSFILQPSVCEQFVALVNQNVLAQPKRQRSASVGNRLSSPTILPLQKEQHLRRYTQSGYKSSHIKSYAFWDIVQQLAVYANEPIAFPLLVIGAGQSLHFMEVLMKQLSVIAKNLEMHSLDWRYLATLVLWYQDEALINTANEQSTLKHYLKKEQRALQKNAPKKEFSPSVAAQKRERRVAAYVEACARNSDAFLRYFFTALSMDSLRTQVLQGERQKQMLKVMVESGDSVLLHELFEKEVFRDALKRLEGSAIQRTLWLNAFQYSVLESIAVAKAHIPVSMYSFKKIARAKRAMAQWECPIINIVMLPALIRCRQQVWLAEWERTWFELHKQLAKHVIDNIEAQVHQESRVKILDKECSWQAFYQTLFGPLIDDVPNKYHPCHYGIEQFSESMVVDYRFHVEHHQLLEWMRKKVKEKDSAVLQGKKAIKAAINKKTIEGYHRVNGMIQQILKRPSFKVKKAQRAQWASAITEKIELLCQEKLRSSDTRRMFEGILGGEKGLAQQNALVMRELLIHRDDTDALVHEFVKMTEKLSEALKMSKSLYKDSLTKAFLAGFESWLVKKAVRHSKAQPLKVSHQMSLDLRPR